MPTKQCLRPGLIFQAATLAFVLLPVTLCSQTHPSFSGSWTRVTRECRPAEKPSGFYQMIIDHKDPQLQVAVRASPKGVIRELALSYKTTGEELHYTGLDGDDFRSKPQWRGENLTFNVIELERGKKIRATEVWSLQDSGTKLIQTKEETGEAEHSTCIAVFAKTTANPSQNPPVKITLKNDRISVDVNGKPFTNLYMGAEANKPFLYPLLTASGKRVTRGFPVDPLPGDPTDHPHQKGLWIGAEHVSGMDFWENDSSYNRPHLGRVVFKDVSEMHMETDRSSFTMLSDWVSLEGVSIVAETRKMTFYANPPDCRMFDVDLELKAKREIVFQDHHDAVIGIRLGPSFDEKNGGHSVNAQGLEREAHIRGQKSEWVDWETELEGEQVGVTLMDHPGNYSWPTRWHVRSMGLLVASPFAQVDYDPSAQDNSKALGLSESLHFRYRVLIHPKGTDVAGAYREFAAQ